jgi:hypothetical protein
VHIRTHKKKWLLEKQKEQKLIPTITSQLDFLRGAFPSEPPSARFWLLSFSGPAVLNPNLSRKKGTMSSENASAHAKSFTLALDTWAVLVALALALAVRFDLLQKVPW